MLNDEQVNPVVAVNAIPLLDHLTGVGQVTAEISRRLAAVPDWDVRFYTPFKTVSELDEIACPDLKMRLVRKTKKIFRSLPLKGVLRSAYSRLGSEGPLYDLYWEPNFIPNDSISARRVVATVHDMSFHEHPEWHPRDRVSFFAKNFFRHIGRSDVVVTVSEFSRQGFLESQAGIPEDRVRVIPCGINPDCFRVMPPEQVDAFRQHYRLPRSFVLFVGSLEPRKNLNCLLTAYERFSPERREACPLILAGGAGWKNKEFHRRIKAMGRGVRTFGYLPRQEDLALMYNAATVFVYPSLYEGFGIPPLEAMACGTPVCLSSIPVFHEVYGQGSAAFADPHDPDSLSAELTRLLDDKASREKLARQGQQLAQRYTWEQAGRQYITLFQELLSS
jgi:glycosyltransferase involved in cell wall biosynthesis